MNLENINTVLLDFDGTIMDTNELILRSWMYAIEKLTGRSAEIAEVMESFGEEIEETMPKLIPGHPPEESIATYREYQYNNFLENIRPFPGVCEALPLFKERGYKVALVTSRLANSTMRALDHFELTKYFDAIITANDTKEYKPDPTPVYMALSEIDREPAQAIMVGDSQFDMRAAANAGVVSALVSYSVALPEEKRNGIHFDFLIDNVMELLDMLPARAK